MSETKMENLDVVAEQIAKALPQLQKLAYKGHRKLRCSGCNEIRYDNELIDAYTGQTAAGKEGYCNICWHKKFGKKRKG